MSAVTPADKELVARVRLGDRNAYGVLVQRHQHALYRHCRGMGIDHDTALDLVQDTFIRGYTRIADCRDAAHVRAWLFTILRNRCLDHLKDVRRLTVSLADVPDADLANRSVPQATELGATLQDALHRLPVALREAFMLKHDAGYSYEEIADMTGANTSAVKMRVHRARETLREILKDRAVA